MHRRAFISKLLSISSAALVWMGLPAGAALCKSEKKVYLRPPGALPEKQFSGTCINCHRCAQACPNDCIKFVDDLLDPARHDTPYITAREKACILCMKCTHVCPSGALKAIADDDGETILKHVKMGVAKVDRNICNSYNGYACGICVRACPFSGVALVAGNWEKPEVREDKCVGCGLCEQSCIHYPKAIKVTPA